MPDAGESNETTRAHLLISGHVQGVFFRSSTEDKAEALALSGWVRNRRDGRVEAVFEGPETDVRQAVDWCRHGPPSADVSNVEIEWQAPQGERGFQVRR